MSGDQDSAILVLRSDAVTTCKKLLADPAHIGICLADYDALSLYICRESKLVIMIGSETRIIYENKEKT